MTDLSGVSTDDLMRAAGLDLSKMSTGDLMQAAGMAPTATDIGSAGLMGPKFVVQGGPSTPLPPPAGPHDVPNILAGHDLNQALAVSPGGSAVYGALDPLRGAGQKGWAAIAALTGDPTISTAVNKNLNNEEDLYQRRRAAAGMEGVDLPRLVGNAVGTTPLTAGLPAPTGIISGALTGGAAGALGGAVQPVYNSNDIGGETLKQTGAGALGGAVVGAAGGALSRLISPRVPQAVQDLRDQGVDLTVGQTMGGGRDASLLGKTIRGGESKLESIPGFGDAIKNRKMASLDSYNRAVTNMALGQIDEALPAEMPAGRGAINYMGQKVRAAYDAATPALTIVPDSQLQADMTVAARPIMNTPPQVQDQFSKILRNEILSKVDSSGTLTGDNLKMAESQIRGLAEKFSGSTDGNQQLLGDALSSVHDALMGSARRYSTPGAVDALDKADRAYAMMLRVENAAGRSGTAARDGIFTAPQLDAAVKQMDQSLRGRAYSRGNALMQDIAASGVKVLGETIPNSGTADRIAAHSIPQWMMGLPLGMTAYSGPAQKALTDLIAGGSQFRQPVASVLQNGLPAIASAAGRPAGQSILGLYGSPLLPPPLP